MRLRVGQLLVAIALVTVAGCTSSGGNSKSEGDWFQARPLIMPGQRATGSHPNSFSTLRVPTSEDAYNALSQAQRDGLVNALRAVDCAHPPQLKDSADRIVCDAQSDAFLLGAALFTGSDVKRAQALPPTESVAGWQLSLVLSSAGGRRMSAWTSQHHVATRSGAFNDVQVGSTPPCGPPTTTPCSTFTAYVSDGVVVALPVTFPPFGQVANAVTFIFDAGEASTILVAHKLNR